MKEFIIYLTLGASAGLLSLAPSQPVSPASEPTAAPVVAPFPPSVVAHDALLDEPQTAVAIPPCCQPKKASATEWLTDANEAMNRADAKIQPLLVFFTRTVDPCREFELNVLPRTEVIESISRFVALRVEDESCAAWGQETTPHVAVYQPPNFVTPVWHGKPAATPEEFVKQLETK